MTRFWILILIIDTMAKIESDRRCISAHSTTVAPVYQSDKELSVEIGVSAQLQCCNFVKEEKDIIWFRQQNGNQSQLIVRFYKTSGVKFYSEFQNSGFQMKRYSNCFNLTISNITESDAATYYCALVSADGTRLKIKGDNVTVTSGTSKPALCEATPHENTINMNMQEKTVVVLGSALGFCVLLIFGLIYYILRRRTCQKMNTCRQDSPGMRQESDTTTVNYAALQFTKRKAEKSDSRLQEDCVYSGVK